MKFIALALLLLSVAPMGGQAARTVEYRRDATYSYPDWAKLPPKHQYDTPPTPAGGMHAFIAQLGYPTELRRRHVGGMVRIGISVDATGRLVETKVLRSAGSELDRIVLDAVRRTHWAPAMKNHSPVAARISFPVTFKPPP